MERKYELTGEAIYHRGRTLHRIRAVRDFGSVRAGDLGGWVESEKNLSHNSTCWVYGHARVYGNARVFSDAQVSGCARVFGAALVFGHAQVSGLARVYGHAQVHGDALVSDYAQVHGDARVSGCEDVAA